MRWSLACPCGRRPQRTGVSRLNLRRFGSRAGARLWLCCAGRRTRRPIRRQPVSRRSSRRRRSWRRPGRDNQRQRAVIGAEESVSLLALAVHCCALNAGGEASRGEDIVDTHAFVVVATLLPRGVRYKGDCQLRQGDGCSNGPGGGSGGSGGSGRERREREGVEEWEGAAASAITGQHGWLCTSQR